MVRSLIIGSLAFGAAFAADRQIAALMPDIKRYDKLRAMSGDPPFLQEQLANGVKLLRSLASSRGGKAFGVLESLQSDLFRYARIRSM